MSFGIPAQNPKDGAQLTTHPTPTTSSTCLPTSLCSTGLESKDAAVHVLTWSNVFLLFHLRSWGWVELRLLKSYLTHEMSYNIAISTNTEPE